MGTKNQEARLEMSFIPRPDNCVPISGETTGSSKEGLRCPPRRHLSCSGSTRQEGLRGESHLQMLPPLEKLGQAEKMLRLWGRCP